QTRDVRCFCEAAKFFHTTNIRHYRSAITFDRPHLACPESTCIESESSSQCNVQKCRGFQTHRMTEFSFDRRRSKTESSLHSPPLKKIFQAGKISSQQRSLCKFSQRFLNHSLNHRTCHGIVFWLQHAVDGSDPPHRQEVFLFTRDGMCVARHAQRRGSVKISI